MKRVEEVRIVSKNTIQLPQKMMDQMLLKEGDSIKVEWNIENHKQKCFYIQEQNNEEQLFNEGFYCIPERIFQKCKIPLDSIQIIEGNGNLTLTTSDSIIASLGHELITCLANQEIDFSMLADDLAEQINEANYEEENI